MNKIEQEFFSKGVIRGGILFLPPLSAIDMVRQCKNKNIAVLGVDGFILTENSTQPMMENSIDLSQKRERESWDEAEKFLKKYLKSNYLFEVVIDQKKAEEL